MKKNRRWKSEIKNVAIGLGLIGGVIVATVTANKMVDKYFTTKINLSIAMHLIQVMDRDHPEALQQAVATADQELADYIRGNRA